MPKSALTALCPLLFFGLFNLATGQAACRSEAEVPSSTPRGDFTDHGDGTVTHQATGLMWQKCPLGQSGADCATGSAATYSWKAALEAAAVSTAAGYTDWRLPNLHELRSIVEERCHDPSINSAVFPLTPALYFWSSSPNVDDSNRAWFVSFDEGRPFSYGSRGYPYHVRLLRSGQGF